MLQRFCKKVHQNVKLHNMKTLCFLAIALSIYILVYVVVVPQLLLSIALKITMTIIIILILSAILSINPFKMINEFKIKNTPNGN